MMMEKNNWGKQSRQKVVVETLSIKEIGVCRCRSRETWDLEGAGPWIMDAKTVAAIQVGSPRENDHCKYPCVVGQPRPARSWGKPLRTGGCILTRRCRTKMPIPQLTGLCFSNFVDGLDE